MGYEQATNEPPSMVWQELDALVTEVQGARAAVAAAQAREAEVLAKAVVLVEARTAERRSHRLNIGNDLPLREISAELGAAMRVGDRTVQRRIDDAHTLVTHFPVTFVAWREGRIDRMHVSTIVDEGIVIADAELRATYEQRVVSVAEMESAGRLRGIARVIAARVDPEASARRCAAALRGRSARVIDLADGLARLQADVAAPLAHGIMDRVNEMARTVQDAERHELEAITDSDDIPADSEQDAGEAAPPARTLDEIRADVLTDLLLTSTPTGHHDASGDAFSGIRGEIHLTVPVTTAAGISDEAALLTGYGPIDIELARQLMAASSAWNRVLTDLPTGLPVAVDRYRPSAQLRRFLDFRDERCRFPGCTMKPWRCDADHTIDAALGGPTCACNLADFCRRHHVLKHASPWRVEQIGGGSLQWTSPTGRTYVDRVPETLRFVPDSEPATSTPAPVDVGPRGYPACHPRDGDPPPF